MDQKQDQESKRPREAALDSLRKKARDFHALFTSPVGVKVLQALEEEYDPEVLFGSNNAETNYKVGARDVVMYIRQMIRLTDNVERERELERQSTS